MGQRKTTLITLVGLVFGAAIIVAGILSLPAVQVLATHGTWNAGLHSTIDITLSGVPPGYDVTDGTYTGWCLEDNAQDNLPADTLVWLYDSTDDPALPDGYPAVPWDQVNYLLNHKQGTNQEVQAALWIIAGTNNASTPTFPTTANVLAMVADAQANGNGFVPGPFQVVAVILYGDGLGPYGYQDTIIEVCAFCDQESSCRVTAGGNRDGVYCPLKRNGQPESRLCNVEPETQDITHTWGGQAGAPPRIDGNWTHKYLDKETRPHNKFTFHSNDLFYIECSDPGEFCQPARFAPNRQIDFSGIGRFTNRNGIFNDAPGGDLCFMVHLEDIGEPGPGGRWPQSTVPCEHCPGTEIVEPDCTDCTDYYSITIFDSAAHNVATGECTGQVLWTNGLVSDNCPDGDYVAPFAPYEGFFTRSGNVQIHPDNNGPN